ncbi:MAG: response regulator [Opitutaceae bacterium]|nr:response regulator [Opitutaceae bacterium]
MPRSILLVEDEGIVASAVAALLRRQGHRVHHVADGESAWHEIQARPRDYDVLLVDINMPRMNGIDFVRHVRSTAWVGLILVMSGRVSDVELRRLEQLRVQRVLTKPFTPDEVAAALLAAAR